jgi:hypothetical protein
MPNFKIVAYLLLGCTDSGGYVKFTPKYIIVGGERGVSELYLRFQSYSFGNSGPHAKFQNRSLAPSRLKGVSERRRNYTILKASLASAEVSAGAVAKADQKYDQVLQYQCTVTGVQFI